MGNPGIDFKVKMISTKKAACKTADICTLTKNKTIEKHAQCTALKFYPLPITKGCVYQKVTENSESIWLLWVWETGHGREASPKVAPMAFFLILSRG